MTRPLWRVGFALIIFAGLYYGYKESAFQTVYIFALLLPFYMLLEPPSADLCETFEKHKADGMPFYVVKYTAMALGCLALLLALYALQLKWQYPSWDLMAFLGRIRMEAMLIIVPVFLMVIASWLTRDRHYQKICLDRPHEKTPRPARKRPQGKQRKKKKK